MNEKCGSSSPNWKLLLLVPAAVILTKGALHRRAMWEATWGPGLGASGHRHGHRRHLEGDEADADRRGAFRLPPKIESMLDAWHTRAHQAADSTEPPTT